MKRTLLLMGLIFSGHTAFAADCEELGVDNAFLLKLFCTELETIVDGSGATRTLSDTTSTSQEPGLEFDWATIGILRDAYRADPATTLELIERIRNAGGLLESGVALDN